MNIIVMIKQVPDTSEVKINRETNTLIRDGVPSIINPFDRYAIEEALRLREQHGGVGAAALRRGQCQGCHLSLTTVEMNRIRAAPPDEVLRCEECRRILVRTDESGL